MINSVSMPQTPSITPAERKYIDNTFRDARKGVKRTEVRDADYALYAAQSCLAKDLVTANWDDARLITAKMNYLQGILNNNMDQDQDISSREMKDKGDFIRAKAEAKSLELPAKTELIRTAADSSAQVLDSVSGLANNTLGLVQAVKSPALQLMA